MVWVWHVVNFFAIAVTMGVVAALLVRLLWPRAPGGRPLRRLAAISTGASVAGQVVGFVVFGDGRMATYALMVLVQAGALGWALRRRG